MVFLDKNSTYQQAIDSYNQISSVLDQYQQKRVLGSVLSLDSEGNLAARNKSFLIEPIRRFFEEKFCGKTYDPEKIVDFLNRSFHQINLKVVEAVDPNIENIDVLQTSSKLYSGIEKVERALRTFQTSFFKYKKNSSDNSLGGAFTQVSNLQNHLSWYLGFFPNQTADLEMISFLEETGQTDLANSLKEIVNKK